MLTSEQTPAHMLMSIAISPHSPLRPVRSMTKHRSRSPVGPGLTEGTIEDFWFFGIGNLPQTPHDPPFYLLATNQFAYSLVHVLRT
jgi:hypothetical protein